MLLSHIIGYVPKKPVRFDCETCEQIQEMQGIGISKDEQNVMN